MIGNLLLKMINKALRLEYGEPVICNSIETHDWEYLGDKANYITYPDGRKSFGPAWKCKKCGKIMV